jgi:hypothetical protein
MQHDDPLYGRVEITEAVLLDLIASDAMQRLKGISQHGITALLGITPPFSRFDHSIGAMLLVRRLGASLTEQVAALLHDVSHTAFSHVIDFVFDGHSGKSYHEAKMEEIVANSDIPVILNRHGMDWRVFLDETKFTLLEQPLPALCADRLDYFLRDLEFLRLANIAEVCTALESLEVVELKIVVRDADAARWLAYTFIEADRARWSNFREVGLYQLTAKAIKVANQFGFLGEADLWGSDEALWEKLQSADHPEVRDLVNFINPGTRFAWNDKCPSFSVATMARSIDPLVTDGVSVAPLSTLDPAFCQYRNEYLAGMQGQWLLSVVDAPGIVP